MSGPVTDITSVAVQAEVHWRRYVSSRAQADLDTAIRLYDLVLPERAELVPKQVRDALIAAYEPDSDGVTERASYAADLIAVARRITEPALVDKAIDVLRSVTADASPDDPRLHAYFSDLGLILQVRYRRAHTPQDLDEAIRCSRRAVQVSPATDPDLPAMRSNLAAGLIVRFLRGGDPADLHEAITVARAATSALGRDDPGLALRTLSDALRLRAETLPDPAALDEAIEVGRAALAVTPEADAGLAGRTSQLAIALLSRFERAGRAPDLDEAVVLLRQAVAACDNDSDRRRVLNNLNTALHNRFERTGERADLDESIDAATAALRGADGEVRAAIASNLSAALLARGEQTHHLADYARAAELSSMALADTPQDHPSQPGRAANLGNALRRRFEATAQREDIDEAIAIFRKAATAAANDQKILYDLAVALRIRYESFGRASDLTESVRQCRAALRAAGPDHPVRATILSALGLALQHTDRHAAVAALREAAGMRQARTRTRLGAALIWASVTAEGRDWASAADGYAAAVGLLPVVASRAVSRRGRESLLRPSAGSAVDACASAVLNGEPGRAAVLLEQGRAVLWTQMLDIRTDLSALSTLAPALSERLAQVGTVLDNGQ
jgi:tetratricopeptide (TPR) repeat protein